MLKKQKLLEEVLQEQADLIFLFLNEEDLKSAKHSKFAHLLRFLKLSKVADCFIISCFQRIFVH